MKLRKRTISERGRNIIREFYPNLGQNPAYWTMLCYLMFGSGFIEENTNKKMLPARVLAYIEGKEIQYKQNNYNALSFLEKFSKEVQPFTWSDKWSYDKKKVRVVESIQWPSIIEQVIKIELDRLWDGKSKRVYFVSGKDFTKHRQRIERLEEQEDVLTEMQNAGCREARELLDYMNNLPAHIFTKVEENFSDAFAIANKLEKDREHQLNLLGAIREQYQPFYKPTAGSTRIFSDGETILGLKKEVRLALTKGWIECDLVSAQLAIAATIWDVQDVIDFLKNGGNIWDHLSNLFDLRLDYTTKSIFKTYLYSLMYGAYKTTLEEDLAPLQIPDVYKILRKSKLLSAIWKARTIQLRKIKQDGGATNCFGHYIPVGKYTMDGKFTKRSILAQLSQAYELLLLYPVVKLAQEYKGKKNGFTLTLWQHDGFSFIVQDKRDKNRWINRLQNAVAKQAQEVGIITSLEVKALS